MSFYVILPSYSCELTQPHNTPNSFVVDWDTPLELPGKWYVALTEYCIHMPEKDSWICMYVYGSIVEPLLIGGLRVPLLRQIWGDDDAISSINEQSLLHQNLDNPMYLPVSSQSINNIEIQIRDDVGNLIKFPQNTRVTLTLHFQQ